MTTAAIQARPVEDLSSQLYKRLRTFEHSQKSVKNRFDAIKAGTLASKRLPTKTLIEQRDQARAEMITFLDAITPDESAILTIIWGNRDWREEYDSILNPKHDPAL